VKDRLTRLAAAAVFVATAFQSGSLAWRTLSPPDPGCAVYEETAGKTDRVALSGGEAVDAIFQILSTTRDPEVRAGFRSVLEAATSGDSVGTRAAQEQVMRACDLSGVVRGYDDFRGQLADRLG
jgi:hypothetical protein